MKYPVIPWDSNLFLSSHELKYKDLFWIGSACFESICRFPCKCCLWQQFLSRAKWLNGSCVRVNLFMSDVAKVFWDFFSRLIFMAISVIAANFDLHRSANWDYSRNVIIKQGHNLTVTCSIAGLGFFDVLRVTHTQGTITRTLSDSNNVKVPYSRIPRYVVHYSYNKDTSSIVSISYVG